MFGRHPYYRTEFRLGRRTCVQVSGGGVAPGRRRDLYDRERVDMPALLPSDVLNNLMNEMEVHRGRLLNHKCTSGKREGIKVIEISELIMHERI